MFEKAMSDLERVHRIHQALKDRGKTPVSELVATTESAAEMLQPIPQQLVEGLLDQLLRLAPVADGLFTLTKNGVPLIDRTLPVISAEVYRLRRALDKLPWYKRWYRTEGNKKAFDYLQNLERLEALLESHSTRLSIIRDNARSFVSHVQRYNATVPQTLDSDYLLHNRPFDREILDTEAALSRLKTKGAIAYRLYSDVDLLNHPPRRSRSAAAYPQAHRA